MTTTRTFSVEIDNAAMQSYTERYKGWKITVEISGDCCVEGQYKNQSNYIARIVVIEQLSIGFRELQVPTDQGYATSERCIQGGISTARQFIDQRV